VADGLALVDRGRGGAVTRTGGRGVACESGGCGAFCARPGSGAPSQRMETSASAHDCARGGRADARRPTPRRDTRDTQTANANPPPRPSFAFRRRPLANCAPTFTSRRNTPPDALARDPLPVADLLARGSPLPPAFPGTHASPVAKWAKARRLQ